ncbi:hypothetical protein JHK86_032505 [Glycine max]|nr:hypothetical protein JHK86_032505 [Glycine max]
MRNKGVWEHASTAAVLVLVLCSVGIAKVKSQSQKVPGLFVFGDSLVEVGNNTFLNTIARANYFPYGIDFSRGSTGRFSNGKSLIDFIDPSTIGTRILYGVNYASASALPAFLTSQGDIMYGDHQYSLSQQVLNFENTLNQYRTMMDASALNQFLASSIAVVVTGSNDYINNYLLPGLYGSSYNYTAQQFGNLLVNKFWIKEVLPSRNWATGLHPQQNLQQNPKTYPFSIKIKIHSLFFPYITYPFLTFSFTAPEWSGEVRNISYSPDSKSVSVVYRVTLYGTDAEKAEAIAFRRACARFGLGLHLYHQEDAS